MNHSGIKVFGKKISTPVQTLSSWKLTRRPGGWCIAENEKGERKRFYYFETQNRLSVSSSGRLWSGEWEKKSRDGSGGVERDDSALIAQFPGKVRKILVSETSIVQAGEALMLVEAMKMEFEIRAPYSGKILRLLVREGQQLSPGDRFLEMKGDDIGKG